MASTTPEPQAPQSHHVGEHWSGANPVPTVQKFIEHLDANKKERDQKIDEDNRARGQQAKQQQKQGKNGAQQKEGEVMEHQPRKESKAATHTVTDPTTGKEIGVQDLDQSAMDTVKDPKLTVPNANLGRPTEHQTSADQDLDTYKEEQDVTAPPDPIAEGTTSDVPIRGEKTNILFHPTPTISFKPMFEQLEKRAMALSIAIPFAIIVLGRVFGGSLWGLIPLAACIATGVWMWVKEVIRSGREMEWSSEQLRGKMVSPGLKGT